jgi:tRNA nucleotidyltransferase/poly(A) polymerase
MSVVIDEDVLRGEESSLRAALADALGASAAELLLNCMAEAEPPVALVGGWLRDLLLGRSSSDIDLVAGNPDALALSLCAGGARKKVLLDPVRRTWRVLLSATSYVDISAPRGEGPDPLLADLRGRDLRVNAIAWSPVHGLLDPLDGAQDLRDGVLRAASETALAEDPLRALRVWRIALKLELQPAAELLAQLDNVSLAETAPERVRTELQQILLHEDCMRALAALDGAGILSQALPAQIRMDRLARCTSRPFSTPALRRCLAAAQGGGDSDIAALRLGWLLDTPGLKKELLQRRWSRRTARLADIVSRQVQRGADEETSSNEMDADLRRWKAASAHALLGRVASLGEAEAETLVGGYLDVLGDAAMAGPLGTSPRW